MEQRFLEEKTMLRSRVRYGDITKAANKLGLNNRQTLSGWLNTDADWPRVNAIYLTTLKEVVRERESEMKAALAA